MITTIEVLLLVISASLLITAGVRIDRNASNESGWLLVYIAGVGGVTAALYLFIASESLRVGVICAGVVLVLRAILRAAKK